MKKGKVIVGALSHKNLNHVFKEFEKVTENDVENWDELVKEGKIEETGEEENDSEELKELLKVTKPDLQDKCSSLNIDFEESDTKKVLAEAILSKKSDNG